MAITKQTFLDKVATIRVINDATYLADYDTVTIAANDWKTDNTADYPAYADIEVEGLTAKHKANVTFTPSSLELANAAGVSSTTEVLTGKIRIRAVEAPTVALTVEIWITTGKELDNAGND